MPSPLIALGCELAALLARVDGNWSYRTTNYRGPEIDLEAADGHPFAADEAPPGFPLRDEIQGAPEPA
jgi:hypothetical protein